VKSGHKHNTHWSKNTTTLVVNKQECKGQTISTEPLKLPWLEDSWVGTTREYMFMGVLREEMLQEGLGSIR